MFEKVLIPTDFSPYAHKILECIGEVPELKDIVLLNVIARDLPEYAWDPRDELEIAERKLAEEAKNFTRPGVNVKVRVTTASEKGIPAAIQKVADDEKVQLVIIGARGNSLIQSGSLGSVASDVLHFGDKNLLIMRYRMPEGFGPIGLKKFLASHGALDKPIEPQELEKFCATPLAKVLVPTDFSQLSEAVISFIKGMKNIGEILLLHVISEGETKEAIDTSAKAAFDRLYGIIQDLAKVGLKATPLVGVGDIVEQICSTAYVENVSLIVMSSIGEDTLERGRIGKIGIKTYDVANSADRSVLILRMKPVFEIPA